MLVKKRVVVFGEVLWDIIESKEYLGGAPFNMAAHLQNLGIDVIFISAIGKDKRGIRVKEALRRYGISQFFLKETEYPTGIVKVNFVNKEPHYEIVSPVAWDVIEVSEEWLDKIKEEKISFLCFGTLAQRNKISKDTLRKICKKLEHVPKFYDINLRQHYYSKEVIEWSLNICNILKINEEEIIFLKSLLNLSSHQLPELMEELAHKYKINIICLTLGEKGCRAYSSEEGHIIVEGIKVNVVDPVGAGDAFSAAFLKYILEGYPLLECCREANKRGAYVASYRGAIPF